VTLPCRPLHQPMPHRSFTPHLAVHHCRRTPQPLLPVIYTFFLEVALPEEIGGLSLMDQLIIAKTATARRRAYPFTGPFGRIVAFEFRATRTLSIYLNAEGDFAE
jgi:hypothetical protein